jgi:hypothetical protein
MRNRQASVMTGTAVVGPPLASGLFAVAIGPQAPVSVPGAPFFLGGVLCLAALLLAGRRPASQRANTPRPRSLP